MRDIRIGKKSIGRSSPCYIIAEAGSNHNGSLSQAKKLVLAAAHAGADAVKFQIFRAKTMYPDKNIEVKYLKKLGIKDSLYNIIKKNEVPYSWIEELSRYSAKNSIEFMATPFDLEAVRLLAPYVNAFKVASYESMFLDLIEAVKDTGKPLLISTGGSTADEIDALVKLALNNYKNKTVLLHCIAKYPAPLDESNLRMIRHLSDKYGIQAGYSDHSEDPTLAPRIAVALGATIIEKHFTISKKLPGPDHAFAVEPKGLQAMVDAIRMTEKMLGQDAKRTIQNCEKELYYYKRCLYCGADLPKGHKIREQDLVVLRNIGKRCNYFNPVEIGSVIGKRLKKNMKSNDILAREDII